jgi:hypothetical protein
MPQYSFTISHGDRSLPSSISDCPDDNAAKREAAGMFADVARDIANDLPSKPDWQIQVSDDR